MVATWYDIYILDALVRVCDRQLICYLIPHIVFSATSDHDLHTAFLHRNSQDLSRYAEVFGKRIRNKVVPNDLSISNFCNQMDQLRGNFLASIDFIRVYSGYCPI